MRRRDDPLRSGQDCHRAIQQVCDADIFMQIMAEKGLVTRDETARAHRYAAAQEEGETQSRLVGDLVRKAFDGSARNLVLHALSAERASDEELSEIRQMLDELERRKR